MVSGKKAATFLLKQNNHRHHAGDSLYKGELSWWRENQYFRISTRQAFIKPAVTSGNFMRIAEMQTAAACTYS